jgi:glucosylceramidase
MPLRNLLLASVALSGAQAQFHRVPVPQKGQIVGEQSVSNGNMWELTAPITWGADFSAPVSLTVSRTSRQQPVLGFGSAFTDTAGWNFMKMNATTRAAFLEAGWGETGAGWTLGRVTINSADYSVQTYAYG